VTENRITLVASVVAGADLDTVDSWLRRFPNAASLAELGIPPEEPSH
jgi:hypothetical protein